MVKKSPQKTTKKTTKKASKKLFNGWVMAPRKASTLNDVKTAILLVSLTINAAFFITWLILRLTTVYDAQVYNFLFVR
jgi:Flp pilus assembly protein TadB